ncbi:MAG: uridine kinase [Myxococcales bacterium]|nr:uridine kinase [Myxococcales bacterium]
MSWLSPPGAPSSFSEGAARPEAGPPPPLVVGIAGGSGSGKTTVANHIRAALAEAFAAMGAGAKKGDVCIVEHDAYYRDRRDLTYAERCQLNFDHPDSLETELLVEHVAALRAGKAADIPIYDFKNHERSAEVRTVGPSRVVIVEGILVFADEALRKTFDLRVYVDTDADIRAFRRIRRDIEHRGRSFESIREQYYATVRPMHLMFVEPSKRHAHVILPEGGDNRIGIEMVTSFVRARARATEGPHPSAPPGRLESAPGRREG